MFFVFDFFKLSFIIGANILLELVKNRHNPPLFTSFSYKFMEKTLLYSLIGESLHFLSYILLFIRIEIAS